MTIRETIREYLKHENPDRDICNDCLDIDPVCLCTPMTVTKEGEKKWGRVLDIEIEYESDDDTTYAEAKINDDPDAENLAYKLNEFLYAAAGYVDDRLYKKWFADEDEDEIRSDLIADAEEQARKMSIGMKMMHAVIVETKGTDIKVLKVPDMLAEVQDNQRNGWTIVSVWRDGKKVG